MSSKTLVSLVKASFRSKGATVVSDLSLGIKSDHAWIIAGPAHTRSTVLEAIRGNLPIESGSISHPFLHKETWPSSVIKLLNSDEQAVGGAAYFSERYHSRREDDYTLRNWLERASRQSDGSVIEVAARMDLTEKLDSSMMNLSNGQSKRAKIARALLSRPQVLLLDEPYVGLDVESRAKMEQMLGTFVSQQSPSVVLALRALDALPPWATHLLWLDEHGRTRHVGPIQSVDKEYKAALEQRRASITGTQGTHAIRSSGEVLVELKHVNLAYWNRPVLQDINWTIRAGEKWRLSGPNGSGKTSILSLITGDHPKIYANQVELFGRRRDSKDGRSIFEIQADMGHTSPEIHKHFPLFRTGSQCIASGFSEHMHPPRRLTHSQQESIDDLVRRFQVDMYALKPMSQLTTALQRLFLLLRALVKRPKLLILDEPFGYMDEVMIMRAKQYIDEHVGSDQALIIISHHDEEVPTSVNRQFALRSGRSEAML